MKKSALMAAVIVMAVLAAAPAHAAGSTDADDTDTPQVMPTDMALRGEITAYRSDDGGITLVSSDNEDEDAQGR